MSVRDSSVRRHGLVLAVTFLLLGPIMTVGSGTAAVAASAATAVVAPTTASLTATPAPKIGGVAQALVKLTAVPGLWQPAPVSLSYQWSVGGVAVAGATATAFTPVSAYVGKTIRVTVTGRKAGFATISKTSSATKPVAAATIRVGTTPIDLVVSSDGNKAYVANLDSKTVSVVSIGSGKVVATVGVGGSPVGLAVSMNGKQVFVSASDRRIYALNIASNSIDYSFSVGSGGDLVASLDGKFLYIGGSPNGFGVSTASIAGRRVVSIIETATPVGQLTLSANGKTLYDSNRDDFSVLRYDVSTLNGSPLERLSVGDTNNVPAASVASADGKTLYVSLVPSVVGLGEPTSVVAVDLASETVRARIVIRHPGDLALSPDGFKLFVVSQADNTVSTISTTTNKVVRIVPVGIDPVNPAVTPDGSKVGVVNVRGDTLSVFPVL